MPRFFCSLDYPFLGQRIPDGPVYKFHVPFARKLDVKLAVRLLQIGF